VLDDTLVFVEVLEKFEEVLNKVVLLLDEVVLPLDELDVDEKLVVTSLLANLVYRPSILTVHPRTNCRSHPPPIVPPFMPKAKLLR
jgi:hypothetical protein